MGTLTSYLQRAFAEQCPLDWSCYHEVQLLPIEVSKLLGYSSRVDVLLEKKGWLDLYYGDEAGVNLDATSAVRLAVSGRSGFDAEQ